MATDLVSWVSGAVVGVSVGYLYHSWRLAKINKLFLELAAKAESEVDRIRRNAMNETVKAVEAQSRLDKAMAITKVQSDLVGRLDTPSKGAAHSKAKNELVQKIKSLEEKKMKLLREVLESGYDPVITVILSGDRKSIRLSEYVNELDQSASSLAEKTDTNIKTERRLSIVKFDQVKETSDDSSPEEVH